MLNTEKRNPETYSIDQMSTNEILHVINDENQNVFRAIELAIPDIEKACEIITNVLKNGGRVFYLGAGTSGRLGICDAAECPPTFGVPNETFTGIIAGGNDSVFRAKENAEDNPDLAITDLVNRGFSKDDVLVGVSASGSASYVISGLNYANSIGAKTVSITNNPDTEMENIALVSICADTGAEVITGSTRMKAGTAQKIILNMLSTTAMIKCGHVYQNMMINLRPTNKKLKARMIRITKEILSCDEDTAQKLLEDNGWNIRSAVKGANL